MMSVCKSTLCAQCKSIVNDYGVSFKSTIYEYVHIVIASRITMLSISNQPYLQIVIALWITIISSEGAYGVSL